MTLRFLGIQCHSIGPLSFQYGDGDTPQHITVSVDEMRVASTREIPSQYTSERQDNDAIWCAHTKLKFT